LRDETQRFKVIFDSIEEGVIIIDKSTHHSPYYPGASAICGWRSEDATGINVETVCARGTEKGVPFEPAYQPLTSDL